MFNFNKLVNNFLVEEDPSAPATGAPPTPAATTALPVPLEELLTKYNSFFPTEHLDINKFNSLIDGIYGIKDTNYLTGAKVKPFLKNIRLFDILYRLKQTYKLTTKDILFSTKDEDLKKYITAIIGNKNAKTWSVPESLDPKVQTAYNELAEEANKLGAVALATLNEKTILGAVQEIIARRSNAFASIMALQKPSTPFAGLLEKIFLTPEKYIAGQAAVTDDFKQVVDELYIEKLFNIALQTKELYKSLVKPPEIVAEPEITPTGDVNIVTKKTPVKGDKVETKNSKKRYMFNGKNWLVWNGKTYVLASKQQSVGAQQAFNRQPVNAGLELFTSLVESILFEVNTGPGTMQGGNQTHTATPLPTAPVPATPAPTLTTPATTTPSKDYTADVTTYTNFFKNGTLPDEFSKGPDGKQKIFNIKTISELGTPESQNLINSLQGIAQYTKSKDGVIAKTAAATSALQSVAAFGGAKLYT